MENNETEAPKVAEDAPNNDPSAKTEISKRQKKKLLKLQKFEERKTALRKREKEKRKEKRKLLKSQGVDLEQHLGPSRKALKKNKFELNPAEISVAVDLSFDELMSDKDLASCASQLMRIYTNNRRAKRPIPLHLTSLNPTGKFIEKLDKNDGWKNWDIVPHEESFLDLFEKEKIIYLTSESETVLDELEKDAIYIIGGLVDHNHHKNLTHDLAQKHGIRSARLPLSEHLHMNSRSVLTINQCFEIILGISEGKSWRETLLSVMPQRKKIKERKEEADLSEESESLVT